MPTHKPGFIDTEIRKLPQQSVKKNEEVSMWDGCYTKQALMTLLTWHM